MHKYALINELVNDQDDSAHVVYERLALDLMFEDFVETLVDTIEHLA